MFDIVTLAAARKYADTKFGGFVPQGDYNPATEYKRDDWVNATGGSYAYINPTPSAGVPLTDTTHWQQIASQGMTGPSAYDAAVAGGYTGTLEDFESALATGAENLAEFAVIATNSANAVLEAQAATAIAEDAQLYADAMASGSPVGVYATVLTLETALPTGAVGAYLVDEDSHLYFWDSATSAWIDGGEYNVAHASKVSITDTDDYYAASNVETALVEIGAHVLGLGVNPAMYTGTDAEKIQAAINDSVTRKTVCIINDEYIIDTSINVPSHCHLFFMKGGTITNSAVLNDFFHHVSDDDNSDITIENATIVGDAINIAAYGMLFLSVDKITITGCSVSGVGAGCRTHDCTAIDVCNNYFTDCGLKQTNQFCILTTGATGGKIRNNRITTTVGVGISAQGTLDTEILDNTISYCSFAGIMCAGNIFNRMIVTGNRCSYNGTEVTSDAQSGINFHGLTNGIISNNICDNNLNYGIDINGSNASPPPTSRSIETLVYGNVCVDNANIGIMVFECTDCVVSNNVCCRNLKNIVVEGGTSNRIALTGNICHDATGGDSIFVKHGDNVLIENNVIGTTVSNFAGIAIENVATKVTLGWNDFSRMAEARRALVNRAAASVLHFKHKELIVSDEITLSGGAYLKLIPMYPVDNISYLHRAKILYTEATSADAGVVVGIGGAVGAPTYYATATTEINKAANTSTDMTINRNGSINANDTMYLYCAGGKIGVGKIKIVLEYVKNQPFYY